MKMSTTCEQISKFFCILFLTTSVHAQVSTEKIQNLSNALENLQKSNARAAEIEREKAIEEEKRRIKERVLKEKFRRQLEKSDSDSTQNESTDKTSNQDNREHDSGKKKDKALPN